MKYVSIILLMFLALASCKQDTAAVNADEKKEATQFEDKRVDKKSKKKGAKKSTNSMGDQAGIDDQLIKDFIKENGLSAKRTDSGIYYVIGKEGNGEHPTIDNTVTCHYEGKLLDGSKFDSSIDRGQPASFPLKRVVKGWQEGIPLISKGGKATLLIPSGLGYGPRAMGAKIPANSVLVFDVELIEIK